MLVPQDTSSRLEAGSLDERPEPMSKYEERKLDGRCTRCGNTRCGQPHELVPCSDCDARDHQMCPRCERLVKKAQARSLKNKRKERRRKKLCAFCGVKSKAYRCTKCRVTLYNQRARPKLPISVNRVSVKSSVDHAGEISREVEGDGYARSRYHGQPRRGQQPRAQLDEQDIDNAIIALMKCKQGLALARAVENVNLPRIQKQGAEHEALSQAAHAGRFIDELKARNNYVDAEDEMIDSVAKTRR